MRGKRNPHHMGNNFPALQRESTGQEIDWKRKGEGEGKNRVSTRGGPMSLGR